MKRLDYLKAQAEKETSEITNIKLVKREKESLEKELSDLKYHLKTKESDLEDRMSSNIPVDMSVIRTSYADIENFTKDIALLEGFLSKYYN